MRKLSIILHGRNDDYQVDWLDRFEYCLNFNINTLKKNKLDEFVEIVIVDYGSEVRIRDTFTILESKCNLSFLNVTLSYGAESDYHVTRALNIGLDNSTSKFCLITSADFIMASHAWSALINKLDTNHQADYYPYLLIPRKQPLFLSEYQKFSFTELDSLFHRINNDKIPYLSLKPAVGGGAGAMVAERSLLARVGFF